MRIAIFSLILLIYWTGCDHSENGQLLSADDVNQKNGVPTTSIIHNASKVPKSFSNQSNHDDNTAAHKRSSKQPLPLKVTGHDWPAFLGANGDSHSVERGIRTDWDNDPPPIVWQRPLGISYGIGSVQGDRLFQFDRFADEAQLVCLNAKTGSELWSFSYPTKYVDAYGYNGGPRASPVIDDQHVFLFGAEGMLHCLNVADGKVVWKVHTTEKFGVIQNFFGVGCTPVIDGKLLIANIGGSPQADQQIPTGLLDRVSGNGSGIVAFDKRTGNVHYQITDELASYASPKLAIINGRKWCFVFARGGLVGFEPQSGKVDFHYPWRAAKLESVNASTPVVVEDEVLITETYGPGSSLLKVYPGGYDVVWKDKADTRDKKMMAHWNTPIHHEGYFYGCSGRHSHNADLRCVHWKTGAVMWRQPIDGRSSLLWVDDHLISLSETGQLALIRPNPTKFDLVAELRLHENERELLREPAWAAPILAHGLLYVRGKDRLVCLELIPGAAKSVSSKAQ